MSFFAIASCKSYNKLATVYLLGSFFFFSERREDNEMIRKFQSYFLDPILTNLLRFVYLLDKIHSGER